MTRAMENVIPEPDNRFGDFFVGFLAVAACLGNQAPSGGVSMEKLVTTLPVPEEV